MRESVDMRTSVAPLSGSCQTSVMKPGRPPPWLWNIQLIVFAELDLSIIMNGRFGSSSSARPSVWGKEAWGPRGLEPRTTQARAQGSVRCEPRSNGPGDAGVSSITRNTTVDRAQVDRAPGRNRTSARGLGNRCSIH
jgi:hypothetical protein